MNQGFSAFSAFCDSFSFSRTGAEGRRRSRGRAAAPVIPLSIASWRVGGRGGTVGSQMKGWERCFPPETPVSLLSCLSCLFVFPACRWREAWARALLACAWWHAFFFLASCLSLAEGRSLSPALLRLF